MTELADLDPSRTAFLLMDYQNGLLSSVEGSDAVLDKASAALDLLRAAGVTIGYVRIALTDEEIAAVPATSPMAPSVAALAAHLGVDSPAAAVHDKVAPREGDIVVRKVRIGGFTTTDLEAQLRSRGIDTLVLAGYSTSGVVLSTVREAIDRDFRLVVVEDLCADRDDEVHRVLTQKIFPRHALVVTADRLGEISS